MNDPGNTPGFPVGMHYHVLTVVSLLASAVFFLRGYDLNPPGQTPQFIAAGTCLICALLCRVIVAIKRIAK